MNGTVDIVLSAADGGTLKSKNSGTAGRTGTGTATVCSGVYCHSDGKATLTYAPTPTWGSTFSTYNSCGSCHGNSPAGTQHAAHTVGIHYDNIYTGTTGLAPSTTAEPLGTRAHGNAATSTTINCNICHSAVTKARNKYGAACTSCHSVDADNTTNAMVSADLTKTVHVNGQPDIAFAAIQVMSKAQIRSTITTITELNDSWTRTGGYKAAGAYDIAKNALDTATMWTGVSKTCSNIACHNSHTVTWSSTVTCNSCHTALP
jgi:predicted CxxxxCH...CXXCH cytochrome family protein